MTRFRSNNSGSWWPKGWCVFGKTQMSPLHLYQLFLRCKISLQMPDLPQKLQKERYKIRILIAKFELNSSNIEFSKISKKTARCGQKWIFENWSFAILTADVLEFFLASWINWYPFIYAFFYCGIFFQATAWLTTACCMRRGNVQKRQGWKGEEGNPNLSRYIAFHTKRYFIFIQ